MKKATKKEVVNAKELEEKRESSWPSMTDEERKAAFELSERYKDFLNKGKTEREVVKNTIAILEKAGYIDFEKVIAGKKKAVPGLKFYYSNRGRALYIGILGKKDPEKGLKIVGAHVDAPRLDVKPNAFTEGGDMAFFKTHYYGGVKKYQWVTTPLAIHGVIMKKDGTKLEVAIGEDEKDPCFVISDILPHLGHQQMAKPANDVITSEQLNVIVGSITEKDMSKDAKEDDKLSVKQSVLKLLFEKYGLCEKDFMRAELEVVPADKARDVGFDRGLVGAYGHDDRICAFCEFEALMALDKIPEHTALCYFADKEEVGSMGNTGARSNSLEYFVAELCNCYYDDEIMFKQKRCLNNSRMLSADVTAAYDPAFPDVFDMVNVAYAGRGIALEKYTGHGGKSGASDACAEFVYEVTKGLDEENIAWQITEMGKIEAGGGGTIAQYMADKGIEVLDCGVALLSMHAPYELASKADIYWSYRAYKNFLSGK